MVDPAVTTKHRERQAVRRRWASPAAWRLALIALAKVAWVRFALWRWPYARVRARLLTDHARRRPRNKRVAGWFVPERDPYALAWGVRTAARRVPMASCLTQALALEALMLEAGLAPEVRIGVARDADGGFEAHAWVEHEGCVLIGGLPDLERFAVLPAGAEPQGRL